MLLPFIIRILKYREITRAVNVAKILKIKTHEVNHLGVPKAIEHVGHLDT
jgi:hypothetical protein